MAQLRDYQEACVTAVRSYLRTFRGNPLAVLPTGAGKSHIIAALIERELADNPKRRILMVTHVKELIEQNHSKLKLHWANAPAGIYCAGLRRRDTGHPIVCASIQSVHKKADAFGHVDCVLIDEAHLVPKGSWGMYHGFLDRLKQRNPAMNVVGLTATPYRTQGGSLIRGDDRVFDSIVYEVPIGLLIERGYLSPVVPQPTDAEIDTDGIAKRNGEFVKGQLEQAAMRDDLVLRAVAEIVELAANRNRWLIFCCGVAHATAVVEALRTHGVNAALVTGETPKPERAATIAAYKAGRIKALVNVDVLTTGFDAPETDCVAILRATQSPGLYVQIVGRGMRTAPGKTDCLVLDFGGNVERHGPIDDVRAPDTRKVGPAEKDDDELLDEEPPTKECPKCSIQVWIRAAKCPECDYVWEADGRHGQTSSTQDLLSGALAAGMATSPPRRIEVSEVGYHKHEKVGGQPSLCVTYYGPGCLEKFRDWICLEHKGFARRKAEQWWLEHMDPENDLADGNDVDDIVPSTIEEALKQRALIPTPEAITVEKDGRYWRVVGRHWPQDETEEQAKVDYMEVPF